MLTSAWFQVPLASKVSQVKVRSGDSIDLLEFVMADGTVKNGRVFSEDGQEQPTFNLGPDEHIMGLEVRQGH